MSLTTHDHARTRKVNDLTMDSQKRKAAEERRARKAAVKAARAERIRALKEARPKPTWQEIGDYCGISARAAQAWQEKGSLGLDNAHRLAELWGVDFAWLYYGEGGAPPQSSIESLDAGIREIQRKVDLLEGRLPPADVLRAFRVFLESDEPRRRPPNQGDGPEGRSRAR